MKAFTSLGFHLLVVIVLGAISLSCMNQLKAQNKLRIDTLVSVLATASEDTGKVVILNALAKQFIIIRDYDKARQNANSALSLAENLNYYSGIAQAYHVLGTINENQAYFPEAIENYQRALKIMEEIGDNRGMAVTYNIIGAICQEQGNFQEALKFHSLSLKLAEKIGDKLVLANSFANIGNVYGRQGYYPKALENHMAGHKILEEIWNKLDIAKSVYGNIPGTVGDGGGWGDKNYGYSVRCVKDWW